MLTELDLSVTSATATTGPGVPGRVKCGGFLSELYYWYNRCMYTKDLDIVYFVKDCFINEERCKEALLESLEQISLVDKEF